MAFATTKDQKHNIFVVFSTIIKLHVESWRNFFAWMGSEGGTCNEDIQTSLPSSMASKRVSFYNPQKEHKKSAPVAYWDRKGVLQIIW